VEALKTALEGTYAMTSDERCKVFSLAPSTISMHFSIKILNFITILCFYFIWVVRIELAFVTLDPILLIEECLVPHFSV